MEAVSSSLQDEAVFDLVVQSIIFFCGSLVMAIVIMMYHTSSSYLPLIGLFAVGMCYPMSMLMMKGIFQVSYANWKQLLTFPICLFFNTVNLLTFVDTWKRTRIMQPSAIFNSYQRRLAFATRRAGRQCFFFSLVCGLAALCDLLSPLLALRTYGLMIFAIVAISQLLMYTLYVPAIIVNEEYAHFFFKRDKTLSQDLNEEDANKRRKRNVKKLASSQP